MQSSTSIQKWSEAISLAQSEFRAVEMSGDNKFDKYVYAKLEDYVRAVRPILAKHGLSVVTSVDDVVALEDRKTKSGGIEHAVRVKMTARIVHNSGEWVETTCWGEGQDRADKSVYKAITGARKYALASALGLATGDDPEGDEAVGQAPANNPARSPVTAANPRAVTAGRKNGDGADSQMDERHQLLDGIIAVLEDRFGADQKYSKAALQEVFGCPWKAITEMDLNALRAGAFKLHEIINAAPAQ